MSNGLAGVNLDWLIDRWRLTGMEVVATMLILHKLCLASMQLQQLRLYRFVSLLSGLSLLLRLGRK